MKKNKYALEDELYDDEDLDEDDEWEDDDEDEDEKKIKKRKDKLNIASFFFLIIGGIGLLSIILSFFVGGGLVRSFDPKDYYGTYYGVSKNYEYRTVVLSEDDSYMESNNGTSIITQRIDFVKTKYLKADKAQELEPNQEYSDCDALVLYKDETQALILWIQKDELGYTFIMNSDDTLLTTKPTNFQKDMGDPRDYFCTYSYDNNNRVTFSEDGTATWVYNGVSSEYLFAFVNNAWLKHWMNQDIGAALIIYKEGQSTGIGTFQYVTNKKLIFSNATFTGTGSEVIPLPDDGTSDEEQSFDEAESSIEMEISQEIESSVKIESFDEAESSIEMEISQEIESSVKIESSEQSASFEDETNSEEIGEKTGWEKLLDISNATLYFSDGESTLIFFLDGISKQKPYGVYSVEDDMYFYSDGTKLWVDGEKTEMKPDELYASIQGVVFMFDLIDTDALAYLGEIEGVQVYEGTYELIYVYEGKVILVEFFYDDEYTEIYIENQGNTVITKTYTYTETID